MSEENRILNGKPPVKFEDAAEFFASRTGRECPACGHNKWGVSAAFMHEDPTLAWGLVAVGLKEGTTVSVGVPTVYATCQKCAYMRLHEMAPISEWIASGKPEFKPDD